MWRHNDGRRAWNDKRTQCDTLRCDHTHVESAPRSGTQSCAAVPSVLCSEMRPLRAQAVVLVAIVVVSTIMLRAGLRRKTGSVRPIPIMNDSETAADNGELPTEEARRVQTEAEQTDSTTSTEVQTDTEATNAQTTPKPVIPAVELTLLRHTSVGKVRASPAAGLSIG